MIPAEVTQIGLVAVGYTTTQDFRPGARPALEEITYQDRWGRLGYALSAGRRSS